MESDTVVNLEVKETPAPEATQAKPTETTPTAGEVVKETPPSSSAVPYSRFSEVIAQKNEALRKAGEYEAKLKEIEGRFQTLAEPDPFSTLAPEEREQTEKFIDKFVTPRLRKSIMADLTPIIQEVQNEKLNKQIFEAKGLADKVGIDFDERLPEIVDYLSRPENRGRLTAREALVSLYSDEIFEKSRLKGKEELSQETKELIEKKKLANMQVASVNPNAVVHSDEMARKAMSPIERMTTDIKKAMELDAQGVRNTKVRG